MVDGCMRYARVRSTVTVCKSGLLVLYSTPQIAKCSLKGVRSQMSVIGQNAQRRPVHIQLGCWHECNLFVELYSVQLVIEPSRFACP